MERRERRRGDVSRIDLEEVAQGLTVFAAAEAIGAERDDGSTDPAGDHVRLALEIVGRRDDDTRRVRQAFGHVRDALLFRRVPEIPSLGTMRVAVELVV